VRNHRTFFVFGLAVYLRFRIDFGQTTLKKSVKIVLFIFMVQVFWPAPV